jgi:hypothetical protein
MYKVASIARLRERVADRSADARWAETHASLVRSVPELRGCSESRVIGHLPRQADPQGVYADDAQTSFDGYFSYWFADRLGFERSTSGPEWRALEAHCATRFDLSWQQAMSGAVEEAVIIDGDPGPYKVVWIVRFKPGLGKGEGHEYWEHVHGPIVRDAGIDRYVQNHVIGPLDIVGYEATPDFDGFSECWFADEQGFIDALATPQWRRLHEDRHQIFDMSRMWCAALDERSGQQAA